MAISSATRTCRKGWVRQQAARSLLGCRWRRSRTPRKSARGGPREELGPELLRRVERAARRRREAEREYEQAIVRAGRLGLAHRDVAAAAQVTHGTVRAIIARAHAIAGQHAASTTTAAGGESGQQPADASGVVDGAAKQA